MKQQLLFDFQVDKDDRTIHVNREFDAERSLVWKAWTTANLLDLWWGPSPWRAETKSMDFQPGGTWLYAMVSPEGEKHWSKVSYLSIVEEDFFTAKDGFCDENGTLNPDLPQNLWENQFHAQDELTTVAIKLTFDSLEDLETIIAMGFEQGFTMGLDQLDTLLENLNK